MLHIVSQVLLEGYIIKSPPYDQLPHSRSWHKRYFGLVRLSNTEGKVKVVSKKGRCDVTTNHPFHFMYWHNESERRKGKPPTRVIPLTGNDTVDKVVHPVWPDQYQHVIRLITKERMLYLCLTDANQLTQWYHVLSKVIHEDVGAKIYKEEIENDQSDPIYSTCFNVPSESCEKISTSSASLCCPSCSFPCENTGSVSDMVPTNSRLRRCSSLNCSNCEDDSRDNRDSGICDMSLYQSPSSLRLSQYSEKNFQQLSENENKLSDEDIYENMDDFQDDYWNYRRCTWSSNEEKQSLRQQLSKKKSFSCTNLPFYGQVYESNLNPVNRKNADVIAEANRYYNTSKPMVPPRRPLGSERSASQVNMYDVPISLQSTTVKRIQFHDATLEVPISSRIKILDNTMMIDTDLWQWELKGSKKFI